MAAPPSTITVYGPDDKPVEVPASEAAGLLRSGQYGLPADAAVPVQKDDGSWETVSGAEAVQRAQSYTTKLGSAADVQRTEKAKEFSGLGKKTLAFGSGLVDSLGVGYGDAALVKGGELLGRGDDVRQFIQDADEHAAGSRMAGKVAGMVLPALASGGGSAAAQGAGRGVAGAALRAATAPARALTAVAEGAGNVAARAAGGGTFAKMVRPMVQQGLEVGVYGSGSAASQMVVRDPTADGEALAAAMGRGFLQGAEGGVVLGGVLGGASIAGGKVADAARGAFDAQRARWGSFVESKLDALRGLEGQARGAAPDLLVKGQEALGAGLDRATSLAEKATGRVVPEAATLGGKADRLARTVVDVDKASVEKALQSLGADTRALRDAAKLSPEVKQIAARQIVEELPALLKKKGQILNHVEQAEAAAILKKNAGTKIGEALERLDATGARVDVEAAVDLARRQAVKPLRRLAGGEGYADRVESYLTSLESKAKDGQMGFVDFHQQRAFLDDLVFEAKASKSPATKALQEVRGALEYRFTKAADEAASAAGGGFSTEYKALKQQYQSARWIEETARRAVDRAGANRGWGLSEQTGAIAGAVLGGGGVTGLATSIAAAAANRVVKSHGDQFAAAVLWQMKSGKPLAAAVADTVRGTAGDHVKKFFAMAEGPGKRLLEAGRGRAGDAIKATREGAEGLLEGAKQGAARVASGARATATAAGQVGLRSTRAALAARTEQAQRDEFERRRREVISYKAGGPLKVEATARRFAGAGVPAEAAQVAATTAARGADHLSKHMPAVPQRLSTLQPELARDAPDPEAMEAWLKRARVVENPLVALDSLGRGTLSLEEVSALREVYPSIYQQVRDQVALEVGELTARGQVLPYDKALALGTLLDVVTDPTLDPSFLAAIHAPPPPPPAPAPGLAPSRRTPARSADLLSPTAEI